jgi:predicted dehydrogenase
MLQGVHTVARLRAVLGEVESVFILEHRTPSFLRPDLEATMSGTVVLEGGLVVWLVQTPETHLAPPLGGFGLYGDDAVVLADAKGYRVHRQGAAIRHRRWPRPPRSSYAEELLAFAAQVAGRAVGPTDGRSERRTLGVMEAALESARTRLPVHLPTRFPGIGVRPGSA